MGNLPLAAQFRTNGPKVQEAQMTFPFVIQGECTPHIATSIFQLLDQNTLAKCRLVSKAWRDFVDNRTSLWGKVSTEHYIKVARKGRLDICRLIIQNAEEKNPEKPGELGEWSVGTPDPGDTPLHWAAKKGHLDVCSLIMDNVEDKNPANWYGFTPLHLAAQNGNLMVCRLILNNIDDKNRAVRGTNGYSPLHSAADGGHLEDGGVPLSHGLCRR